MFLNYLKANLRNNFNKIIENNKIRGRKISWSIKQIKFKEYLNSDYS